MSGSVKDAPLEDFESQWRVNSLGPVVLYRAAYNLLAKSEQPQVFIISSAAGSIELQKQFGGMPNGAYGATKT